MRRNNAFEGGRSKRGKNGGEKRRRKKPKLPSECFLLRKKNVTIKRGW